MILFLTAIAASISLSDQAVIVRQNVASDRIDIEWTNTEKLAISIPLIQGQILKNVNYTTNGQLATEKTSTDESVTEEQTTESSRNSTITTEVTTENSSNPTVTSEKPLTPSETNEKVSILPDETRSTTTEDVETETDVKPTVKPTSEPEIESESITKPEAETTEPTTQKTTTEQPTTESTTTAATTTTTEQPDLAEILGHRCLKTADNRYVRLHIRDSATFVYPIDGKNWMVQLTDHCRGNEDWNINLVDGEVRLGGYFDIGTPKHEVPYMTAHHDGSISVDRRPQTWKPHKNEDGTWSFESPYGTWLSWSSAEGEPELFTGQRNEKQERFTIEPYPLKK